MVEPSFALSAYARTRTAQVSPSFMTELCCSTFKPGFARNIGYALLPVSAKE